ncbi:MAG: hypothetical protein ABR881_29615 [Candidatus Sulfotelmatobacter sp.]|jgi:hypothetical protein
MSYITPLELIYRQISQSSAQPVKPVKSEDARKPELSREDVDLILQRKRSATPEELQFIITSAKFKLTEGERNQLSVDLTIAIAQRTRQGNGRCEDASARFIHDTLGMASTPWGLVERAFFESQLRSGAEAIVRCLRHRPPRCQCWVSSRNALWHTAHTHGERSPEAYTALKVWEALEELEFSSRPDGPPTGYGFGYFDDHWRGVGTPYHGH